MKVSHAARALACALAAGAALSALPGAATAASGATGASCQLGPRGAIRHVIYLQFDNVHLRRDNPNVPSDLEQMPHLLNFLDGNGTVLTNHHTPLMSHTADDLVTSITGLYGDRHGLPVANTFRVYNSDGSTNLVGDFAYWTDPLNNYDSTPSTDTSPTLVAPGGGNPPAPWVSYTRAGCNFGSVAMADTELENTTPDVPLVFGANSPQAREAEDPNRQDEAARDFEGLSIHCAQGAALCAATNGGVADRLPSEPTPYQGYQALFGSKYIAPQLSGGRRTIDNLDGQPIVDGTGKPGFPGYDGLQPVNSLAYTLALQEHGVPVTYTYISSAHENANGPFGPGQAPYVAQLKRFDRGFATFFAQLAAHGISPANTLFFVGSDENDQFVGSKPAPSGCDGISVACNYTTIGEIDANVQGMLAAKGITTPFDLHEDSAPAFYLHGQPAAGDPAVRAFERAAATLQADNPYTGGTNQLAEYLADPTELRLLHMVTGDPARTPTFSMFADPHFWAVENGATCGGSCSSIDPQEGWNHGTVDSQITNTWAGLVGPGIARLGADGSVWSDHADVQPTLAAVLGLHDDYVPQGRVLSEVIRPNDQSSATKRSDYARLAAVYKQIEAPVGELALATLAASTKALASNTSGDRQYTAIENAIADITHRRDDLGAQMISLLDGAAFGGHAIDPRTARALENDGAALIAQAQALASQS